MDFLLLLGLIAAVVAILALRRRITAIENQAQLLTARLWQLERHLPQEAPPAPTAPPPAPPVPPPPPAVSPVPAAPPPEPLGGRLRRLVGAQEWEAVVGGNLLNKLGALLVIVALALFLGYSFTHMGPAGRIIVALAVSTALLAGGFLVERRAKYRIFAWGLLGAGWAGLYITAYSAYALDAARVIENATLGAGLQLAVAGAMIAHSLRYRTQTVTGIAAACAYAALGAGGSRQFAMGGLIPLSAALMYLTDHLRWRALGLFSLVACYGIVMARGEAGSPLWKTQAFLFALWLIFEVFDLLGLRDEDQSLARFLMPLNALGFLGLSYMKWESASPDRTYLFFSAAAALYLADAILRGRLRENAYREPIVLASALAALSIVREAGGPWAAVLLGVEAELLFLFAVKSRLRFLEYLASIVFGAALVRLIVALPGSGWTPAALSLTALAYANREIRTVAVPYGYAGSALVLCILYEELPRQWLALSWTAWAVLQLEAGLWRKQAEYRLQAYAAWALAVCAFMAVQIPALAKSPPTSEWASLSGGALLGWWMGARLRNTFGTVVHGVAAALALCAAWCLVADDAVAVVWMMMALALVEAGEWIGDRSVSWIGHGVAALVFLRLLAVDCPDKSVVSVLAAMLAFYVLSPRWNGHSWLAAASLAWLLFKVISGSMLTMAWGVQGLLLLAVGFPLRERMMRLSGLALFAACIGKLFFYDLRNLETIPRIFSFFVLGVILLGVSWAYARVRKS